MIRILRNMVIVTAFMTRLPLRWPGTVDTQTFWQAMRWLPVAGIAVGSVVAGGVLAGQMVHPLLGALVGLILWVAVTGGLHLDGLSDVADALGAAHRDPQRLLAVMKDPHIGSFGAMTLGLQLLAKYVLLYLLASYDDGGAIAALIAIATAARIAPLVWARALPPLGGGLGAMIAGVVQPRDGIVWLVILSPVAFLLWPILLVVPVCIAAGWWFFRNRLGGVNGDCHGAGIEVIETILLGMLVIVLIAGAS